MDIVQRPGSYRFDFKDTTAWLNHLREKGFVVVSGLISQEDCKRIVGEMKNCLQQFSPLLTDEKSWTQENNYPYMLNGGMIQYVAHTRFQWELREKVSPIFSKIWGCEVTDLATSFDGFCFMDGKRKYKTVHPLNGAHSDQSPQKDYLWSVQGLVSLCDNEEDDGGLIVIPESHKVHHEFFKKLGKENHIRDWYKFTEEEKKDEIFSRYIKVCGKAGDFMMWDSRTFHCNTVPTSKNIRACVYVCQIPKDKVPEKSKKKRETAWAEKKCSNHHPGDGFELFPSVPRNADPKIKEIVPLVSVREEELTELQRSLLHIA